MSDKWPPSVPVTFCVCRVWEKLYPSYDSGMCVCAFVHVQNLLSHYWELLATLHTALFNGKADSYINLSVPQQLLVQE